MFCTRKPCTLKIATDYTKFSNRSFMSPTGAMWELTLDGELVRPSCLCLAWCRLQPADVCRPGSVPAGGWHAFRATGHGGRAGLPCALGAGHFRPIVTLSRSIISGRLEGRRRGRRRGAQPLLQGAVRRELLLQPAACSQAGGGGRAAPRAALLARRAALQLELVTRLRKF